MPVTPRHTSRLQLAAGLTLLATLSGCTGVDTHATRTSTAPASPAAGSSTAAAAPPTVVSFPSATSDGIVLAVDQYALSSAQTAYLFWAAEVATAQCVRDLGFDVPQPKMPTPAEIAPTHDRRYGVTSATAAATFGYHLPNDVTPSADDPYKAVPAAALDGGIPVLNGHPVPDGGCRGQTTRTFEQNAVTSGMALTSGIDTSSYAASLADPRLQPVFADWSACMAQAGFSYATPNDAIDAADLSNPTPSAAEIATASADVNCKAGTDLVARWSAIDSALEMPDIAANLPQLQQYEAAVDTTFAVAQRLTSVPPPP